MTLFDHLLLLLLRCRPPPATHLLADGDPMTGVTTHFFLSLFFFDTWSCILHFSIDELRSTADGPTRRRQFADGPTRRRQFADV